MVTVTQVTVPKRDTVILRVSPRTQIRYPSSVQNLQASVLRISSPGD